MQTKIGANLMNKTQKLLTVALDYISKGWCKGYSGLDKNNKCVCPTSKKACSWCATGAITAATYKLGATTQLRRMAGNALRKVLPQGHQGSVAMFNDWHGTFKHDVIQLFEKAIKKASKAKKR